MSAPPALPAHRRHRLAVAGRGLALAAALACARTAAAPAQAAILPPQLEGHESVATADGALGTLFNPALVGLRYPSELLIAGTRDDLGQDRRWDVLTAWRGLGLRWTRIPDEAQVFGATLAFGSPEFRFGWTTEWTGGDLGSPGGNDHRLGLASRPNPWLSIGATVDHPFQPDGTKRVYTVGAALRPFALTLRSSGNVDPSRFTIFGEAVMPEGGVPESDGGRRLASEWRYGAELEFVQGVALRASYQDDNFGEGRGNFGVVFRLPRLAVSMKGTSVPAYASSASEPLPGADLTGFGPHGSGGDSPDVISTVTLSLHSGEDATRLVPRGARRVGTLELGGVLGDDALAGVSLLGGPESVTPVGPIVEQLDRARRDPLTRGVLLELGGVSNQAAIEEIRPHLLALRAAGKPVVAYLEYGGGRGDLVLASACDLVFASEEALFWQLGLRSERRYYRRLLDKLGVKLDRSSVGRYKSAYREYSVDSIPPADREVVEHVLDQAQAYFTSTVAAARHMDPARLDTLLDGRQWPSSELAKAGLIDSVGYREQAVRALGRLARLGARPRAEALAAIEPATVAWQPVRGVAVVYASGAIETGESGNDLFEGATLGSATLVRQIEAAFRTPGVRAVVLRIDSPGGSVLASDLVYHALLRMKQQTKKPLIVSMGSVAASGGYYIALPGDRLFADRMTRTGSIGVVFLHPSFEGFYAKHDVHEDDFQRGAFMQGGSVAHDWDPLMQASADSAIVRSYDRFVDRVALARGLSRATVLEHAQGRVWLGDDARERKLVDEIGGLDAALAYAQRAAGIPANVTIEPLEFRRPRPGLLQRVVGDVVRDAVTRQMQLARTPGARWEAGDDFDF